MKVNVNGMTMKRLTALMIFAGIITSTALFAQTSLKTDPCQAKPTAGSSQKTFLNFVDFNKELRTAISTQDAVALAFLVRFPLRVNEPGGTISLDDAAALKSHFSEVFTPRVREQILATEMDEAGCSVEGVGYGLGVIWVNASDRGYAIWAVNSDWNPPGEANTAGSNQLLYVCQTEKRRILIDSDTHGYPRYRAWNKPRPVTGKPDIDIANGKGSFEGTDLCTVPIYTFKNSDTEYRIAAGCGCSADTLGPRKDATGELQVIVAGKQVSDVWCY